MVVLRLKLASLAGQHDFVVCESLTVCARWPVLIPSAMGAAVNSATDHRRGGLCIAPGASLLAGLCYFPGA